MLLGCVVWLDFDIMNFVLGCDEVFLDVVGMLREDGGIVEGIVL